MTKMKTDLETDLEFPDKKSREGEGMVVEWLIVTKAGHE
jgi:hypothetical protein